MDLGTMRLIYFSAGNIDINDGTLDGKHTFHPTQYADWQRGTMCTRYALKEVSEYRNGLIS